MSQASGTERVAAGMSGHRNYERFERVRWQILASIVGPIAWLSLTLLYVGFWAQGFSVFQSIIVVLVSGLILAGVLGVAWTAFGIRHRDWFDDPADIAGR